VYIPSLYYLGLGRLGFRLPKALVAPGYCCLVFVSGFGMLGGGLEVSFCLLHSESECGAGLVVVFGYHYVRLDSCPLLVLGVHILLLPFGGMKPWVANGASDGGVFFWDATSLGRQQLFPVAGWLLTGGGGCLFPSNPLQDGGQYSFIVFGASRWSSECRILLPHQQCLGPLAVDGGGLASDELQRRREVSIVLGLLM
jgi:hypothetical protein